MADGNFDNVFASGRVDATQDVLAGASIRAGTFARVAQDLEVAGPTSLVGWVAVGHRVPRLALDVTGNGLLSGSLRTEGGLISAGPVGILTSAPTHPLHVQGVAQVTDLRAVEGVSVAHTDRPSQALDVLGNVVIKPRPDGSAAGNLYLMGDRIGIGATSPEQLLDVKGNVLVRASDVAAGDGSMYVLGRLGIGTTVPNQPLHVVGSAQVTDLRATEGVSVAHANRPSQALDVRGNVLVTDGSGAPGNVYVLNGRIGVGTSSPSEKLDVQGSAVINGNLGIRTSQPGQALDVAGNANVRQFLRVGAVGAPTDALDVTGNALVRGALSVGPQAGSPRRTLDVTGDALFASTIRADGHVGIGEEPAPSGGERLRVTGNVKLAGLVSATQFKTSGGHLEIANDGHIEATRLTLRPYGVSPGAAVLTVDTLGNIVATSFRGAGVDSSNTVRAEFGFYAGPGGTPRKIADANGCYYA